MKAGDSKEEFVRLLKGGAVEPQDAPQAAAAAAVELPAPPAPAPAPATPPRVPAASSEVPGRADNSSFLLQQRKRQQEASEERQRILQLLENDKKEREARQRKVAEDKASSTSTTEPREQKTPRSHSSSETAISFRMLDGLSLKAKFPSSAILATDVREFVDEHRTDSDHPYNFLQILTPLPNKQITISEENSTLSELGLSPTCTLVLVPTSSSPASAYSGGGGSTEAGGIFSRIYGLLYSIVTTILGHYPPVPVPANAELGQSQSLPTASLLSLDAPTPPSSSGQASPREEMAGTRIRTLYDGRGDDEDADRKYYNGNQVCRLYFSHEG